MTRLHLMPPATGAEGAPSTLIERALGTEWGGGLATALVLAGGALLLGASLVVAGGRRAPEPSPGVRGEPTSPFARLLGAASLVVVALVISRFRFYEDDFFQLIAAVDHPWRMDDSLRLFSGALLYGVGLRLGLAWYVGVNLIVWIGSAATLHALLRRAGRSRDEALIAAALAGVAPGYYGLVCSAIGLQTSASIGLYYAILLLVDHAARTRPDERERRIGFLSAALGLTALGVFVKYPMMSVVPLLTWVWARHVVRDASPPLSRHAFHLVFVAAVAVPLVLTHPVSREAGELTKAGTSAITSNLVTFWERLSPSLWRLAHAAAVLYLGIALQGGGAGAPREAPGARVRRAVSTAREDLRRLLASDHLLALAALAAIAIAPFLLNARYFAPYYVVPSTAWIAAIAAVPLAAAARRLRGVGLLAAPLAVWALLPVDDVQRRFDDRISNRPAALLDAVHGATAGLPAPCGVRLEPRCETPEATLADGEELGRLFDAVDSGTGLRWATGWHEVEVVIGGDGAGQRGALSRGCAAPLTLRYCKGKGVWAADAPR